MSLSGLLKKAESSKNYMKLNKDKFFAKRKTLQVIQPTDENAHILVGRNEISNGKKDFTDGKERKETAVKEVEVVDKETQTNDSAEKEGEVEKMIYGDEPPAQYWEKRAERRRIALEDALKENVSLHKQLECLQKEKVVLLDMVEQGRKLAELFTHLTEEVTEDCDEDQE